MAARSTGIRFLVRATALCLLAVGSVAAAARDHRVADAVERRDSGAAASLLQQGADPNGTQPDGATALQWAAHLDDLAAIELLIGARADRKSTRLNSSHIQKSRMPSSA